jgi:hypothetical protein
MGSAQAALLRDREAVKPAAKDRSEGAKEVMVEQRCFATV